jgi:osmotically inducible protein OsmC
MTTFQETQAGARSSQEDMKVRYTAKTHTSGGRRGGVSRSDDGRLDVKFSAPGAPGSGTNPEQLFAAGWSACFISAMGLVANKMKVQLPADAAVHTREHRRFSECRVSEVRRTMTSVLIQRRRKT